MNAMLRGFAWIVVVVVLSGCATMCNPASQAVPVASAPMGAPVFIDGEPMGRDPSLAMPRKDLVRGALPP